MKRDAIKSGGELSIEGDLICETYISRRESDGRIVPIIKLPPCLIKPGDDFVFHYPSTGLAFTIN